MAKELPPIRHPYTPSNKWREILTDPARYKVVCMGRRSGKSTAAINLAFETCLKKKGARVWIVGPTYAQVRDIYWLDEKMKEYILPIAVNKRNISELRIEFKKEYGGGVIQFKGADRPDTLVGVGLDLLICDEVAKWRYWKIAWEQNLAPTIKDKGGKVLFCSTPQGYDHFYELFAYAESGQDLDWKAWQVPTWESGVGRFWAGGHDAMMAELEKEKAKMTEDTYMQEYGAQFRAFAGRVFTEFLRDVHVQEFEVDEKISMECGMDFGGTAPTAYLMTYFDGTPEDEKIYVVDEYYQAGLPMIDNAGAILAMRAKYSNHIAYTVADSASPSDIREYAQMGIHTTPVKKVKQSIHTSISRLREKMKVNPIDKKPRFIVHPRCQNLVEELESYKWKEHKSGGLAQVPEDENDHAISALRYIILHHRVRREANRQVFLGGHYKPRSHTSYFTSYKKRNALRGY